MKDMYYKAAAIWLFQRNGNKNVLMQNMFLCVSFFGVL